MSGKSKENKSQGKERSQANPLLFFGALTLPFVFVWLTLAKVERHGLALESDGGVVSAWTDFLLACQGQELLCYGVAAAIAMSVLVLRTRRWPRREALWESLVVTASLAGIVSLYFSVIGPAERIVEALSK